jgi:nucleolar protein 56
LAKAPASTVQILGAEKALFRALKTKGNTPKYGLIYHSTFIGRAEAKNKGRISRYLANKCSIATRIDSFSDNPTRVYGEKLREQVEERLKFYETGQAPRRNIDVMEEIAKSLKGSNDVEMEDANAKSSSKKAKKDKKRKSIDDDEVAEAKVKIDADSDDDESPKKKKDKKKKKKKSKGGD